MVEAKSNSLPLEGRHAIATPKVEAERVGVNNPIAVRNTPTGSTFAFRSVSPASPQGGGKMLLSRVF